MARARDGSGQKREAWSDLVMRDFPEEKPSRSLPLVALSFSRMKSRPKFEAETLVSCGGGLVNTLKRALVIAERPCRTTRGPARADDADTATAAAAAVATVADDAEATAEEKGVEEPVLHTTALLELTNDVPTVAASNRALMDASAAHRAGSSISAFSACTVKL